MKYYNIASSYIKINSEFVEIIFKGGQQIYSLFKAVPKSRS